MHWLDKVIDEIKSRCWSKYDVDGIQGMLHSMKHPVMPDEVEVVEIEAIPEWEVKELCPKCGKDPCECEDKIGEAEKPELPTSEEPENDEAPFEDTTEEKEALEEETEEPAWDTPAEQDNAEEIINAIKKFYPWQDVKDILIKMVWKLMGL